MKKWNKWLLLFVISGFLVACGKDNNVSSGTTSTTTETVNETITDISNVQYPTTVEQFREFVRQDKFVYINQSSYIDRMKFTFKRCDKTNYSGWDAIKNMFKSNCSNSTTITAYEYAADKQVDSNLTGKYTRADQLSHLLSLIDGATRKYFGTSYAQLVVEHSNKAYIIDLSAPAAANPKHSIEKVGTNVYRFTDFYYWQGE